MLKCLRFLKVHTPREWLQNMMKTVAVIPAAGSGIRMGGERSKQFLDLNGRPVLAVTLSHFQKCAGIDAIILVVPSKDIDYCRIEIIERYTFNKVKKIVPGGKMRQDSVRLGIEGIDEDYGLVLIHDGVRPLIDARFLQRVIDTAKIHQAVITGLSARETVKEVNNDFEVVKTCDRDRIWMIQTPQVFRYKDILKAHQKAYKEGWDKATDDSFLIERLGIPVKVVEGSETNIKITTPYDLKLAGFILDQT